MATSNKISPKQSVATSKATPEPKSKQAPKSANKNDDFFEVDMTPPPLIRSTTLEAQKFLEKLERTVTNNWQIGGAIIIPAKKKNTALKYLKDKYSEDRWAVAKIVDNENDVRIYRMSFK